jgi:EAL and modified HD-GYP domain-containing signal transduction protein
VVLEILERVSDDDEVVAGVRALRDSGFLIAIDDWTGDPDRMRLFPMADIVKIDVEDVGMEALPGLVAMARTHRPGIQVVVERVETQADVDGAVAAGADLLQGFFLERPVVLESRTLSANQITYVRLLSTLAEPYPRIKEIERLVGSDPGLVMRILRTAGSVSGTGRTIGSLRQAIVLLGFRALASWVSLAMLAGTGGALPEVLTRVLTRAEAVARLSTTEKDRAYTAGLLSAVAEVLDQPLCEICETSGADQALSDAVQHHAGPSGRALAAVLAYEIEDDDAVIAHGYTMGQVSMAYLHGLRTSTEGVAVLTA